MASARRTPRQPGRRKPNYDDETAAQCLKKAKPLKRTDFGGKDPNVVAKNIVKKLRKHGATSAIPRDVADAVRKLCEDQVEGVGKRMFPRIDEVIKRIETNAPSL